jgi:hypothetical protein
MFITIGIVLPCTPQVNTHRMSEMRGDTTTTMPLLLWLDILGVLVLAHTHARASNHPERNLATQIKRNRHKSYFFEKMTWLAAEQA